MTTKVAFVLPSLAGGGAERVTLSLLNRLNRGGFAPSLILFERTGPLQTFAPPDVQTTDLARPRLRRALPRLISAIRRERPNVVVSTFGYVNLALLAARHWLPQETRLVLREANLPSLALPQARFGRLMAIGYRRWYRRADRVIATSERMASELAERYGVPRPRLALLPNPVDEAALRQSAAKIKRVPGAGARFVAAGRLVSQKGFDRLLKMVSGLPKTTQLTILGDGPDREALGRQADDLRLGERVVLAGHIANPWEHYAGADAYLLPSRWEGMSNAALEALACGTRVIATPQSGGIAELAALAPPGAVTIAESGAEFTAALAAVSPDAPRKPRPSLLPSAHQIDNAVAAFEAILAETAR